MKLLWAIILIVMISGVAQAAYMDDETFNQGDGVYLTFNNTTFDNLTCCSSNTFNLNVSNHSISFTAGANKTITNPTWSNDNFSFEVSGSSWLNFSVVMTNTSNNYNLTDDGSFVEARNTSADGVVWFNTTGTGILSVTRNNTGSENNIPIISFVDPTPANNSVNTTGSVTINTTVSDADGDNLTAFINWNSSLVGCWRMNEAAGGTNIEDCSGNGLNGTWSGNATSNITTGMFGNALLFNGIQAADRDKVSLPDSTLLNFSTGQNFTLATYFNSSSVHTAGLIDKLTSSNTNGYRLYVRSTSPFLRFVIYNASSYNLIDTTTNIHDNTWHSAVATYNTTHIALYLDGVFVGATPVTAGLGQSTSGTDIGTYNDYWTFNGSIDEVLVFNRTISSQEVLAYHNASANQLTNTFSGLNDGIYNYTAYVQDSNGATNLTETRTVNVSIPLTEYMPPTPVSCGSTNGTSWINVSCSAGFGNVTDGMNFTNTNTSVWLNGTQTWQNFTGLSEGTLYEFNIYAYNSSGVGSLNLTYAITSNTTNTTSIVDYYVSKTGSDSNSGNITSPFLTIQKAVDTVTAGGTVYIQNGTYNELIWIETDGTPGNEITYTTYLGEEGQVIIDGTTIPSNGTSNSLFWIHSNYTNVSNLVVKNSKMQGIRVEQYHNNVTIYNNTILNTSNNGIKVMGGAACRTAHNYCISNISILYNNVSSAINGSATTGEYLTLIAVENFEIAYNTVCCHGITSSDGGEGIDASSSKNGTVHDNHVYDIHRVGIYVDSMDGRNDNVDVYNNRVYDITGSGILYAAELSGGIVSNLSIYNNVVHNISSVGLGIMISSIGEIRDVLITSNTLYGTQIANNASDEGTSNITTVNNVATAVTGVNNISLNNTISSSSAFYVDAANDDFHLASNSSLINIGNLTYAAALDFDGVPRPYGSLPDIGAYEYVSGTLFSISGYVNDTIGDPINTVSVEYGTNTTTTNATGYYILPNMYNGTWNLSYSKSGYVTGYKEVTISGADQTNQNVTLSLEPETEYIPPSPINLTNNTGNFWVNYTYEPDSGNITDSYNVSQNGTWTNGTTSTTLNSSVGAHGWSNISVYAYNSSGTGSLNATPISQNTQVPNNPITGSGVNATYNLNISETLYIDANYTDEDNDTATYTDNTTKFDIDPATGIVSWIATSDSVGNHYWNINVSDGYGSVSTQAFTVTVNANNTPNITSYAPETPNSTEVGADATFNVTVNQSVQVTWYVNGTSKGTDVLGLTSTYTNYTSVVGTWNVTAIANNGNGSDSQTWIWTVTAIPTYAPAITVYSPADLTPTIDVNNLATFEAWSNQSVNWTWTGVTEGAGDGTNNSFGTNTWTTTGAKTVTVTCSNANGSCGTIQWDVTVVSDGGGGGTDYDYLTGTVVPSGSTITINPAVSGSPKTGGSYTFGYVFVDTQSYWVNVSKTGYTSQNTYLTFNEDHEVLNITLVATGSAVGNLTLNGTVTNASLDPLENIRVDIKGGLQEITDANGFYEFSGITAGNYTVLYRASDTNLYMDSKEDLVITTNTTQNHTMYPRVNYIGPGTARTPGFSLAISVISLLFVTYIHNKRQRRRRDI